MIRTFRYPLILTNEQRATFESWRVACQQLYNAALEQRKDAYRKQGVSLNYFDQCKELTALREAFTEWKDIPILVERSAVKRLHLAFQAFFRRLKNGEKPGFPRYRGRDRYDSFGIGKSTVSHDTVTVPKLGTVRFKKYRELKGKPLDATIVRSSINKWYVCIVCDVGAAPAKPAITAVTTDIGIDVGLSRFITDSNGISIANPRFFRTSEKSLANRQRRLARKKKGSNGRKAARLLVAKAYEKMRNQRIDFARKLAVDLFSKYDVVSFEDLNIRGLASGMLAKSVNDAAWGLLLRCLAFKAEEAGKYAVAVDPRGTSIDCSGCCNPVPKGLDERMHNCDRCGLVIDRDHNAAINILARGRRAVQ